jgi:uncharacterized protein
LDSRVTLDAIVEAAAPALPGRRWKFWGTTLWAVAILATFVVVTIAGLFAMVLWLNPDIEGAGDQLSGLLRAKPGVGATVFGAALVGATAVLALAVRMSRVGMREYLGLVWPRARDVGIGFAGLLVIYLAFWLIFLLIGHPPSRYVAKLYREAQSDGTLPLLLLGVVIVAPVGEEVLIRGFLYRGWATSRLGPSGAIVLTSVVWTALHTQYEWTILAEIFCIGLLYGSIRRRSGSTVATIMLHVTQNAGSFVFFTIFERLGLMGTR